MVYMAPSGESATCSTTCQGMQPVLDYENADDFLQAPS